jgi:tRNA (adenine22-N1)-methyltransferase
VKLSKRLLNCAQFTVGFNRLADIGTDHAHLPIHCVKEGFVSSAMAIDNKEGPFVIAFSNVKKQNLDSKITVIKGDGLDKIDENVDVVVISGMGGSLISRILMKNDLKNVKRFILQPNNDTEAVRRSLKRIGFKIIDEIVLLDSSKIYDIIVIEKGKAEYNNLELIFGPINLSEKPFYFTKRIQSEIKNLTEITNKVIDPSQKVQIMARIKLLEEALV